MYTSTREVQRAFRKEFKNILDFSLINDYDSKGKMYKADTRIAFVDYIDDLYNNRLISDNLRQRTYLSIYLSPTSKK